MHQTIDFRSLIILQINEQLTSREGDNNMKPNTFEGIRFSNIAILITIAKEMRNRNVDKKTGRI